MPNNPPSAKKRKLKTTTEQYQLYLDMLESNTYFRENKVTPDHPTALSDGWNDLVKSLNSSGGSQKNLFEWKRTFTDWKSQVRKRARLIKMSMTETGNTGEPEKTLTEMEKKLLYLTGDIVVEGIKGAVELGVENTQQLAVAAEEEKIQEEQKINEREEKISTKKRDSNILKDINSNLEKLVKLKEEELQLTRLKLKLKYNFQEEEKSEEEQADNY